MPQRFGDRDLVGTDRHDVGTGDRLPIGPSHDHRGPGGSPQLDPYRRVIGEDDTREAMPGDARIFAGG